MHPPFRVGVNRGHQTPQLVKRSPSQPNLRKESQVSNAQAQYTSDMAKTEEFFVNEKFITFPQDHQLPSKEEPRGKVYCKYQKSWNHSTNAYWSFKNIIQDKINKGILKFLEKKEAMVIDEDSFPPVASINIVAIDLKAVLNAKNDERFSPNARVRKVWISKQYLVHRDELAAKRRIFIAKEKENNGRYPYHSK